MSHLPQLGPHWLDLTCGRLGEQFFLEYLQLADLSWTLSSRLEMPHLGALALVSIRGEKGEGQGCSRFTVRVVRDDAVM